MPWNGALLPACLPGPLPDTAIDPDWPGFLPHAPTTSGWLALWTVAIAALYAAARIVFDRVRRRDDEVTALGVDCTAFASSVLLVLGTIYPHTILTAIGDPGPFLDLAGIQGVLITLRAGFGKR